MRIMDVHEVAADERQGLTDRLLGDEQIQRAFQATNTAVLFTDRRIITIQRNTLLSEKVETTSFSYRAVRQFSVLEGMPEEGRSELKIWLGADPQPLHLRAVGATDLAPVQLLLAGKLH